MIKRRCPARAHPNSDNTPPQTPAPDHLGHPPAALAGRLAKLGEVCDLSLHEHPPRLGHDHCHRHIQRPITLPRGAERWVADAETPRSLALRRISGDCADRDGDGPWLLVAVAGTARVHLLEQRERIGRGGADCSQQLHQVTRVFVRIISEFAAELRHQSRNRGSSIAPEGADCAADASADGARLTAVAPGGRAVLPAAPSRPPQSRPASRACPCRRR